MRLGPVITCNNSYLTKILAKWIATRLDELLMSDEPKQGAGAALKRAEIAEHDAYDRYQAAQKEYDDILSQVSTDKEQASQRASAVAIAAANLKLAHSIYKASSASLLSYDKTVDQSKRLEGESISQKHVQHLCGMWLRYQRIGTEAMLMAFVQQAELCGSREELYELLGDKFRYELRKSIETGIKEGRLDAWLRPVVEEEL